ncbi:MAG: ribosome maturation factor RimM [Synechococcus sp. SB0668_bin_15]|nr:ribosome maturation factor RimM [Synechococcus sp. SB0668_bin_15]MXZ83227.1 ribosome maturation factor RimM [Synechococcus sp. SB0666_bin_14]MYA90773.1 ribosome maturation factor RimM [Synechococcus sp. SB0663_bin_10]MYC49967.1 ribosome maturation factor RimM [Synechococcus sp. SB0662_bin_14]MYG46169.1 ribosome maturation factor RimM [Synechococcus sp. SB0675_bin_6]MYJ60365.1 ribosome maturation factor RimM [Synechococcus sp. SB0672_bin_6]MYK91564.1 ribosome maturation factor RimM [Synecho
MSVTPPLVEVGLVVAAQGLKGELRVLSSSDFAERFLEPGPRWLRKPDEPPRAVELLRGRCLTRKGLYGIRLKGVTTRNQAETLVRHRLLADATTRPPLGPGEFHLLDLEGLEVRLDPAGPALGAVVDLVHGGNDLLKIRLHRGGQSVLVPFVEAIVPQVRIEEGWILLCPPAGLLPIEAQPPPADAIGSVRQPEP